MEVEFRTAQRYDGVVAFISERPARATRELRHIPGVLEAEAFRSTPIRITRGAVTRTTTITGIESGSNLIRLADGDGATRTLPPAGVIMNAGLASVLGARAGDTITVELIERGGDTRAVVVAGIYDPLIAEGLFMARRALNEVLRERDVASGAYLALAPGAEASVFARFKNMPGVAGAMSRATTIKNIDDQIRQSMVFVLALITGSACVIAMGVVYNSARIALSERGRELASLRVLGFTTNEVAGMLLGEQVAVMVLGLPAGVGIGALFSLLLTRGFANERFHFPYVVAFDSQVIAMAVVAASAALASVVVHRRVGKLNLVQALRTRE
jgi:putative ABC transport system permease protein